MVAVVVAVVLVVVVVITSVCGVMVSYCPCLKCGGSRRSKWSQPGLNSQTSVCSEVTVAVAEATCFS